MNKLLLTVGLPRSGKTTWALIQKLPVVSRDAIREALHGKRDILEAEDMITSLETLMVKSLFLAGHDTVIVDATHLKKAYRDRWKCSKYSGVQWELYFEFFKTDVEICVNRAIKDNRPDLIPIILAMAKDTYDT